MGVVPRSITVKDDTTFLVSDLAGDVTGGPDGFGMYLRDTRYLSRLELAVDGRKPQALSYALDYNIVATFHLSTGRQAEAIGDTPGETFPRIVAHAVGITRKRYIDRGLVESISLHNYHPLPVQVPVDLRIGADFADIFEVRGMPRTGEGHTVSVSESEGGSRIVFLSESPGPGGMTEVSRQLVVTTSRPPDAYEEAPDGSALNGAALPEVVLHYDLTLQPHESASIDLRLMPQDAAEQNGEVESADRAPSFDEEVARMRAVYREWQEACATVKTGNYLLDGVFRTSTLDLRALMQQEPRGLVVTAGLPWYFTLFGRDSLVVGLQTLMLNPQIAVDTLRVLAAYQADGYDDWRDMEPGKILHELRRGDMTLNGETPHGPYYGSVDSTLLFILLFAETLKWRDDPALFAELWPTVRRALAWAETYGDADGDGYIEFERRSARGILHQGWKDSDESMGGDLGPRPRQPLALVEVQGYYYAALVGLAGALRRYGDRAQSDLASRLEERARGLKEQFNRDFWWPEEGFFAQALDANKQQVRAVTSNPGHCLWSGILDDDKAVQVARRMVQPDMLSGWGVRTMSAHDPSYNPMSYHNGSIWPHDNSLLVMGLRRYGLYDEMLRVAGQILDAAASYPDGRLPELYCGFARGTAGEGESAPVDYPVSCSPQAWAAGTPVLVLQALLGLEADAAEGTLQLSPVLPEGVDALTVAGVQVGDNRVNMALRRDPKSGKLRLNDAAEGESAGVQVVLRQPGPGD